MSDPNPAHSSPPSEQTQVRPVPADPAVEPVAVTRLLDLVRTTLETTLAKALARFETSPETNPVVTPGRPPPSAGTTGLDLKSNERTKAADLRLALLMGKIPEVAGLLIDAGTLAKLLDVSRATLHRLDAEEALPAPIELGRLKKWRLAEILEWIESDCPLRKFWVYKRPEPSNPRGRGRATD